MIEIYERRFTKLELLKELFLWSGPNTWHRHVMVRAQPKGIKALAFR